MGNYFFGLFFINSIPIERSYAEAEITVEEKEKLNQFI